MLTEECISNEVFWLQEVSKDRKKNGKVDEWYLKKAKEVMSSNELKIRKRTWVAVTERELGWGFLVNEDDMTWVSVMMMEMEMEMEMEMGV